MGESVLINGINYSWGDITLILFSVPIVSINDITYSIDQKKVDNYGAGNQPISRGRGNKTYKNGSITIMWDELRQILKNAPFTSLVNIPPFSIPIIFQNVLSGLPPQTDTLLNVEFTEDPFSSKQNDTAIWCKLPFIFAGITKTIL